MTPRKRRTLYRSGPKKERTRKREPPCRIHGRLLPLAQGWREEDRKAGIAHVIHDRSDRILRIGQAFETAAELAGLDRRDLDGLDRIAQGYGLPTPHALRHARATLMLQAGVAPEEVGQYLGMSLAMVLKCTGTTTWSTRRPRRPPEEASWYEGSGHVGPLERPFSGRDAKPSCIREFSNVAVRLGPAWQ